MPAGPRAQALQQEKPRSAAGEQPHCLQQEKAPPNPLQSMDGLKSRLAFFSFFFFFQKQVLYEWFSTRRPTNVRCVTGEGAAAFPAAPRVPGRRALRTGPRSRRAAGRAAPRPGGRGRRPAGGDGGGPAIRGQPRLPRRCRIVPPGRDSDLEAFSHNPTDGSFAPLAPQPSTYTKCLNLRFLSY